MAYPPPPYKDAVVGTFLAGEAIAGAWWAYPPTAKLGLRGIPPGLTIVNEDTDAIITPPTALLGLKGVPPALGITSTLSPPQAELGLGSNPPVRVGQPWLWPVTVSEVGLEPAAPVEVLALTPAVATEVLLVPTLEETG